MKKLLLIIITLCFSNCNLSSPVGFWKKFEHKNRIEFINQSGLFGGIHILHWVGNNDKYNKEKILKLTTENGWVLKKEEMFSSEKTKNWEYEEKKIFPLSWRGFESEMKLDYSSFENFPRWISGEITVLSFETKLVSIDLETQENILINGFILLNKEGNEMTLYHQWGE